ncbi:MAG: energy-coupling factor ABC transporter ATP-binding protein [bacterium]
MRMDANVPLIRLREIRFAYPYRPEVLRGIDLDFFRGDRIGLVGANGSGKTTLFHIIMGLLRPKQGAIEIFGSQRREEKDFHQVREKIGLLFQDPDDQLFSPTVAQDVAFGPLNLGKSREEAMDIVHETLGVLGLSGFEERVTYQLSGGEKKLVSLATVLSMQPEVLLLDEPVAGLDESMTERFMTFLKDSGLSYIIVSHDHDFLLNTTESLYQIKDGRLRKLGKDGQSVQKQVKFKPIESCISP